jgi:hypothetical protein
LIDHLEELLLPYDLDDLEYDLERERLWFKILFHHLSTGKHLEKDLY